MPTMVAVDMPDGPILGFAPDARFIERVTATSADTAARAVFGLFKNRVRATRAAPRWVLL